MRDRGERGGSPRDARSSDQPVPLAPPRATTRDGTERRVGVEIECIALTPYKAARIVADHFGGTVEEEDPFRFRVRDTRFGTFTVELDTQYAHPSSKLGDIHAEGEWVSQVLDVLRELDAEASRIIGTMSESFVPLEIVGPPMPWSTLGEFTDLLRLIHEAGASGTRDGVLYAFGLHLNPEVPAIDAGWITRILQAYNLMSAWLRDEIDVDVTRRILPFIDPFPKTYTKRILHPSYRPGMDGLIDDYLAENATRNRELDMLPLFAAIDAARVRRVVTDSRVKARPTLHYRLPDTRFESLSEGPVAEWNRWVLVERLAENGDLLRRMADAYLDHFDRLVPAEWTGLNWLEKSRVFIAELRA